MRRTLLAVLAIGVSISLSGCASSRHDLTGTVTNVVYEKETIYSSAKWAAGVQLADGSVVSIYTSSGQTLLAAYVSVGNCIRTSAKGDNNNIGNSTNLHVLSLDKCKFT